MATQTMPPCIAGWPWGRAVFTDVLCRAPWGPHWLYWYDATRAGGFQGGDLGWTRLETVQHYAGAAVPAPRSIVGWTRTHAECQYAFLNAVAAGKKPEPGLEDGLRAQLVLDGAYRSAEQDTWVNVPRE